jgi:hypothetical protein
MNTFIGCHLQLHAIGRAGGPRGQAQLLLSGYQGEDHLCQGVGQEEEAQFIFFENECQKKEFLTKPAVGFGLV